MTDSSVSASGPELVFVSHAGPDGQWAEWIAWHLLEAGYEIELDLWDWPTGDDFVKRMNDALERASAVVALFSPDYFAPGRYTEEEWTSVVARRGRFVPLVVKEMTRSELPAILVPRIRTDLYEAKDEGAAVQALRKAVRGPERPVDKPDFPLATRSAKSPRGLRPRLPSTADWPEVWDVRRLRNPHFTGRDAVIDEVRRRLLAKRQTAVQALHGGGGIGKTQVALEYAYRFAGQYDVVWWVDAEQGEQVPARYAELAAQVGVARPDAGVEANARFAMEYLRTTHDRWLVVLDNAEDPKPLRPWLPNGSGGHLLITARNPSWSREVAGLRLEVFSRAESLAYLTGQLPTLTGEQAEALGEALGDLPLALAQAAGVLGDGMPHDRYRELLETRTAQILGHGDVHDYPATLAATVTIAAERLEGEQPEAAAVLRLASFLGPEPIPTEWLDTGRTVLRTIPGDPDDFRWPSNALNPLARYGLAVVETNAFQVHRLTQAVIRNAAGDDTAAAVRDDVAALLGAVDPGDPDLPEAWPRWAALTPHVAATMPVLLDRPELRPALLRTARYLARSDQYQAAQALADTLHRTWALALGEDDPDTLHAMHMVTWAMDGLAAHAEVLPLVHDLLERRRRVLGENSPDTLRSAYDLGVTLGKLSRWTEAHAVQQNVLERSRTTLGENHPDTLRATHSFAWALHHVGRNDEALRVITDALPRQRAALGDDHWETLESIHLYGRVLSATDRPEEAHQVLTDVIERQQQLLGDHTLTFNTAASLGEVLLRLGRHREAEQILKDTRTRMRGLVSTNHHLYASIDHYLASALRAQGKHHEAQKLTSKKRRRH